MPVVAAFSVPQALAPSKNWAGVVSILQNPDDVGGATGTLLPSGQHVLTAAHVLDADGNRIPDAPYYYVNIDLPAGRVQMVVPSERIVINPEWQGATEQGFKNGHDVAVMQLSGVSPWGNGPGNLGFDLYSGPPIPTGSASPANLMNIVGYGYAGNGYVGQNSSPNPNQIASTVQTLMLPPTATGSFSLRNPTTRTSIRLNAKGLTEEVVRNAVVGLDPSGFTDVQVVQRLEKSDPSFGSFDIVFRQVDTTRYEFGVVPALQFQRQQGFSGGSQSSNYRTGIARPAFPTILGAKRNASTYFNMSPDDMPNVLVSQLSPSPRLAILGEGDSGGPAFFKKQIAGVASFYTGNSQFGEYSGWSDVSEDLSWIKSASQPGGHVIIDLAAQPVTIGNSVDYVTVKASSSSGNMVVLVHGREIYRGSASAVQSVQIVPRGVPTQFRTVGNPPFQVNQVPNNQKGFLKRVEQVAIMGQTVKSPAVVIAKNLAGGLPAAQAKSTKSLLSSIRSSVSEFASSAVSTVRDKVSSWVAKARKALS